MSIAQQRADEQAVLNTKMREYMDSAKVSNVAQQGLTMGQIYGTGISNGTVGAAMLQSAKASDVTHIVIRTVANGRTVHIDDTIYVVAPGQSLLDVIGQALVEIKLEE
jgi:hypothetical protein